MKYTIQPGDTLSQIALTHYGNAELYHDIKAANIHKIPDADSIVAGDEIYLPDEIQGWPLRQSRMMAAAPDLLEALTRLMRDLEDRARMDAQMASDDWREGDPLTLNAGNGVVKCAYAAIAKATGKQS